MIKKIISFLLEILNSIIDFCKIHGIAVIAVCSLIIVVVTLILDFIIFFKQKSNLKNISLSKLKEEILHEFDSFEIDEKDKIYNKDEGDSVDNMPI